MKICMITDLHLADAENAVQHKVLDWAVSDITKKNADLVVFAGDYTANGLASSLRRFQNAVDQLSVPVVIIPGNSDFRTPETKDFVRNMASFPVFEKDSVKLIGLMDGEGAVSDETWEILEHVDGNAVVCGHHPPECLRGPHGERLLNWLKIHPDVPYFCGHLHYSGWENKSVYLLTAADPDKAIGENPGITYYDTDTKEIQKSYFDCPVPIDFPDYIGISCRNPEEDIPYAMEHSVHHLELRGNFAYLMSEPVKDLLQQWRNSGGVTLSVHAPDIFKSDWTTYNDADWVSFTEAVNVLSADRITLHVPNIAVASASESYLHEVAAHVAEYLSHMPEKLKVGIENMHMTPGEKPDAQRRFGYLPGEVMRFVSILGEHTTHLVGSHLDVGHARNNAPFSQKYPIGSWYCLVGHQANGYHIHQVVLTEHGMENHMPIDNWYGSLISYASFFREWDDGVLAKAPVFLEIRPKNGHKVTIEMLK